METLPARNQLSGENVAPPHKHADLTVCHLNFGRPFATPAPLHNSGPSCCVIESGDMRMFRMHGIWRWLQLCSKGAMQVNVTGRFPC